MKNLIHEGEENIRRTENEKGKNHKLDTILFMTLFELILLDFRAFIGLLPGWKKLENVLSRVFF